jgi:uncharacterized protein YecA (UPF0149 family)
LKRIEIEDATETKAEGTTEIDYMTEDDPPIGEMDNMIEGEAKKEEEEEIDMREEEEENVVEAQNGTIGEEANMDIIRKRNEVEAENAEKEIAIRQVNAMSTRTKVSVRMKREQDTNVSLLIRKKEIVILTAEDPLTEGR